MLLFIRDNGRKEAYYDLMNKLKVAPGQRISRMSNGQRSQVALGADSGTKSGVVNSG